MAFMAAALPYIAAAGSAVSAFGAIQQGQQASAAASYNAQAESQRATQQLQASQSQAQIVDQQNREKLGEAASAFGAAGVDMSGTPLSVMSSLASKGELNKQLTLYQGKLGALASTNQAALDTAQGNAAASGSIIKAGSTLLTGPYQAGQGFAGTSPAATTPLAISQNPFAGGAPGAGGMT